MKKMVQKSSKKSAPKASSLKSSATNKKVPKKSEEQVTLSNGYDDSAKKPAKNTKKKVDNEKKRESPTEQVASISVSEEQAEDNRTEESEDVNSNDVNRTEEKIIHRTEENVGNRTEEITDNRTEESSEVRPKIDEAECKVIEKEPIKKPQKSQKRKNLATQSIQGTSEVLPTSRMKSKRQKVLQEIPSLRTIPGKVFVIGENDVGQLGLGENVEVRMRPALLDLHQSIVDIAAGGMHSVCLTESGEVITFGCNDEGALGRITVEEGSEYTPHRVEIPERIVRVSAGDSHSAALSDSGHVYIWGNFRSGVGPMGLTADGAKQMKPVRILNDITIVSIASGNEHLACVSADGITYTLGCGEVGQLGRIAERNCNDGGRRGLAALLDPQPVSILSYGKPVLFSNVWTGSYATFLKAQGSGLIYAFGLNNYNHLGHENERVIFFPRQITSFNNRTWSEIDGGQHHTLALDNEGIVYALGRADYGRLGLGEDCEETSEPTAVPSLQNDKCVNISGGNCVSFAVTDTGSLYSWGMGDNHQLGHGNDGDCHVPQRVEGTFSSSWRVIKVSGGGQHVLILTCPRESQEEKSNR